MALVTPIVQSINAFDSNDGQIVTFNVTSGDQVVKNRITVRNNVTNEVVYQNTVETYAFTATIPPYVLTNGEYYNCYINTYNVDNERSANSNVVQFYCLTTPTLEITNIPVSEIIDGAGFTFNVRYMQQQKELLNELYLYLYDDNEDLIQTSNVITSSFTPPLTLQYTFDGFEDSKYYYIQAVATTLNGTKVATDKMRFFVQYSYETAFFRIMLENNCQDGYVGITSNLVTIQGETDGGYFASDTLVLQNEATATWDNGFAFYNDKFIKQKWWNPIWFGQTNVMSSEDGLGRIEIEYKRGVPQGQTEPKDYLEVRGYYDDVQYFMKRSNYIVIQNNNSRLMSYVKINGTIFDIRLVKIITEGSHLVWNSTTDIFWNYANRLQWNTDELSESNDQSYIEWNGISNMEYNKISNMYWNDEVSYSEEITGDEFDNTVTRYELSKIVLSNSVVDDLYITKNVDEEYGTEVPIWNTGTVFNAGMNGNLDAGNITWAYELLSNIKVKRRLVGTLDWVTIYNKRVSSIDDLFFSLRDYFVPSGKEFEYAIVPCVQGEEQSYFTLSIETKFLGIFVSDLENSMRFISGASYPQDNITQDIGILKPFNQVYPTIIQNAKTNFRSLTVSGDVLDNNNRFDAEEINEIRNKWTQFLTDGKVKFVKDWNGGIIMGRITTPPSFTYKNNGGMVVPTISFVITEQGKYDNISDLIRNGFIEENDDNSR